MIDNRAVVVDRAAPGHLAVREVAWPEPKPSEAVVGVRAISLNRGETRRATSGPDGWRPGWDLAGVVVQAAADGSGPSESTGVVGLLSSGAWAEFVAVPTNALAELPDAVSFGEAATLPVAGLTALHALARGGLAPGRSVCVTGATGGVGTFAIQLAHLAGARVTAQVRRPDQASGVRQIGADAVVVGATMAAFDEHGPYDLILESVGGTCLGAALATLARGGSCVSVGGSASHEATCDFRRFRQTGRTTLYGFQLFDELAPEPASAGLARLVGLVAEGRLKPIVGVEVPWSEIAVVAHRLLDRQFVGKAVLHVSAGPD